MLEYMLCGMWFLLGAYALWFISKAKTFQPITLDQLAMAWKVHKHEADCNASQIHDLLVRNEEVVGFRCDCGYEWLQKRPITQRSRLYAKSDKPQSIGEIEGLLQRGKSPAADLDIRISNIKRV
jgi:hypothetical protein